MNCLLSANTVAEEGTLELVKSMLEEAGIACVIRKELCTTLGLFSFSAPVPELWILEDAHYAKAKEMAVNWLQSAGEPQKPWSCPRCQKKNEGQFAVCWKCGTERGET